ncbi:hypothetical protein GT370_13500 [Acidocella sp. MX-AZ03]|uniref:hypothetical protein n=1 Tax=Acidocella sp. MX-AZ03 TaxID=2697363 RepID=UPI0022DE5380|nr:hypothetical protein [Acidocella sp. MX-AZ03]WBO58229.1 hypothetical protein GT370_13500 [Acidocella sp. MX-AZ03]
MSERRKGRHGLAGIGAGVVSGLSGVALAQFSLFEGAPHSLAPLVKMVAPAWSALPSPRRQAAPAPPRPRCMAARPPRL